MLNILVIPITPETIASFQEYFGINYTLSSVDQYHAELAHLIAQTSLTSFTVFASLLLVVFVEPPIKFFVGGDEFSGDWRPTLLAIALLVGYLIILFVEPLRAFFEMVDLPVLAHVGIAAITLIWLLLLRMAWRQRWMEHFLGVEAETPVIALD